MRILLVSSMFPGREEPDYGVFVKQIADALEARGHELCYAVSNRRSGGPAKHVRLAGSAWRAARRFRPDVVYAHYLVPAGLAAAAAARLTGSGLVLTAHGRDVRNVDGIRGVRGLTALAVQRADSVVAVSDYLRRELLRKLPGLEGRIEVIDSGVDMDRFRGRDATRAREQVGWQGEEPFYLCVGRLDERKNVLRLAEAFERVGRGSLGFVGDGPLRSRLEGRPGVRVVGRVPHDEVATWIAACDVLCQPSLVEPFGQALLEAMASERSVVATEVGGPPEFVSAESGILVDAQSLDAIAAGLRRAAELPRPNHAARTAASAHDVRVQAERLEAVLERAAAQ
ncbi:MAG TPA: glycosyltransferase [Gaiellaceae bacterium]|nr:glycosyltransferase [Gaiellaceae bacterium]